MKIQAKVEHIYNLSVEGKPIGKFEVVSEWEGMIKLKSSKGIIIAHKHSDTTKPFTFFDSLVGQSNDKELVPIMASPGLLDDFVNAGDET